MTGWNFGIVKYHGAIVAVGATLNDGNGADSGHVRVYKYNGANLGYN